MLKKSVGNIPLSYRERVAARQLSFSRADGDLVTMGVDAHRRGTGYYDPPFYLNARERKLWWRGWKRAKANERR